MNTFSVNTKFDNNNTTLPDKSTSINNDYDNDLIETIQSNVVNKLENELINDIAQNSIDSKTDLSNIDSAITCSDVDANTSASLDFLNDIIYQLDEMLTKYPEDSTLNTIIPNSKFVCVDGPDRYVLGVIYENSQLKYIAYGVPSPYNSLPPNDFGKHYQWLPINSRDVMSDGYYMIFQDALTGALIEIDFEE